MAGDAGGAAAAIAAGHAILHAWVDEVDTKLAQLLAGQAEMQGQLQAHTAAMQAHAAAMEAQLSAIQAQLQGAGLVPVSDRIALARAANHHDRDDPYVPVPTPAGAAPAHWPAGFSRPMLRTMPREQMVTLLGDYGIALANDAPVADVLMRVCEVIGSARM